MMTYPLEVVYMRFCRKFEGNNSFLWGWWPSAPKNAFITPKISFFILDVYLCKCMEWYIFVVWIYLFHIECLCLIYRVLIQYNMHWILFWIKGATIESNTEITVCINIVKALGDCMVSGSKYVPNNSYLSCKEYEGVLIFRIWSII